MKNRLIIWRVIKAMHFDGFIISYITMIVVIAFTLYLIEPNINSIGNGFWYCFAVISTIGFGDIAAVTVVGRILTIILGIYSLFVTALTTGIVVSYYQEKLKERKDENLIELLDELEHLEELPKERLKEISKKIKNHRIDGMK